MIDAHSPELSLSLNLSPRPIRIHNVDDEQKLKIQIALEYARDSATSSVVQQPAYRWFSMKEWFSFFFSRTPSIKPSFFSHRKRLKQYNKHWTYMWKCETEDKEQHETEQRDYEIKTKKPASHQRARDLALETGLHRTASLFQWIAVE